ncbi:hypothetical protein AB0D65_21440 [Streptomyces griseoloalbus]|uniref:Dihydrofolate reductase n=1 Tax=Streptomyces griseoloalbus TaxID=67303 RepID=A0ABV3E8L2_9ACTN
MGRIVISEYVTLDGVVEDPTGEEGFSRGGWFLRMSDCCSCRPPRSRSPATTATTPARA